ncbi:CitMHS family citrate-Mg2+:H+ or citrate-Ca2+:H+ symporter [Phenylobacterium koreense]|uniref:CitMHS family citrate-Mg2+:H+ or citrate-Ca2+:H+ symporter n=2 Tax=Caulobacteraceae TaxID=76892 RepID=A0ABV2EI95_9CAUL
MMLSVMGFAMVATFMTLIMTRRLTPLVALISVPIIFGLLAGFGSDLGPMMLDGISKIAPTGVLLMFAILYFGLMIDSGLFDPLVGLLLRLVHGDPVKIVVGTVVLATLVSLDGDGSTTYMITVAALLPLYRRMGLNPLIMACLVMLSSGLMNLTPWGGPTARVATALQVEAAEIFLPMIPAMAITFVWLLALAYFYGRHERRRLGSLRLGEEAPVFGEGLAGDAGVDEIVDVGHGGFTVSSDIAARRPRLIWFNAVLTAALMALLVLGVMPLPVLFMAAFCVAGVVNYPSIAEQKARVAAHSANVMAVVSLIFAAGIFTGILNGTGMVEHMSRSLLAVIPPALGPYMAPITGLISLPMTFFVSNDAFYFGMAPILAETASHYGISAQAIGRASLVGQPLHLLSPLVPSTYLLVSLAGVEFGEHQKFTARWAVATSLVMLVAAMAVGAFPLVAGR